MKNLLTPLPLTKDNSPPLSACITHSDAEEKAGTQITQRPGWTWCWLDIQDQITMCYCVKYKVD